MGVVERTPEGGDNIEVPLCGGWIDLGCRASGYRRDHPQPRRSDGDFRVDPVVLTPGRWSIEIYVCAKPDRIHRDAHHRFECREARVVDQRYVFIGRRVRLAACVRKGVPWRLYDAQRSSCRVTEKIGEELGDKLAPLRGGYLRTQQHPVVFIDRQNAALSVEAGPQL